MSEVARNHQAGLDKAKANFELLEGRIARAHDELDKAGAPRELVESPHFPGSLSYRIKQLAQREAELAQRLNSQTSAGRLPLEERLENQAQSIASLYKQRDELRQERDGAIGKLRWAQRERDEATAKVGVVSKHLRESERTVELFGRDREALRREVRELRQAGAELQARLRDREWQYTRPFAEELDEQRARAERAERQRNVAQAALAERTDELVTLRGNHARQAETIADFQRVTGGANAADAAERRLGQYALSELLREVARRCD